MGNLLLILIAIVSLCRVECTMGQAPCVDEEANIDCAEVNEEYDNERVDCKEMFNSCINRLSSCVSTSTFCSDKCRSIYQKVLLCRNDSTGLLHLETLNLLCASASDPQYEDWKCLDFSVNARRNQDPEYPGYLIICYPETLTNFSADCMNLCRNGLMMYRNNCCGVNIAVVRKLPSGQSKSSLINLYSDLLWKHCGVESPQLCPDPACPTSPVLSTQTIPPDIVATPPPETDTAPTSPVLSTQTIPPDIVATPPPETGAASKHCMNWFVLFIIVLMF